MTVKQMRVLNMEQGLTSPCPLTRAHMRGVKLVTDTLKQHIGCLMAEGMQSGDAVGCTISAVANVLANIAISYSAGDPDTLERNIEFIAERVLTHIRQVELEHLPAEGSA